MDALSRLDRIKHKGQTVAHIGLALIAGYFIALVIYISLLFLMQSF